jgi:hypothetical protein
MIWIYQAAVQVVSGPLWPPTTNAISSTRLDHVIPSF